MKLQVLCSARIAGVVGRKQEQTKARNEVGNVDPGVLCKSKRESGKRQLGRRASDGNCEVCVCVCAVKERECCLLSMLC